LSRTPYETRKKKLDEEKKKKNGYGMNIKDFSMKEPQAINDQDMGTVIHIRNHRRGS
jgi:hypothetical protein